MQQAVNDCIVLGFARSIISVGTHCVWALITLFYLEEDLFNKYQHRPVTLSNFSILATLTP